MRILVIEQDGGARGGPIDLTHEKLNVTRVGNGEAGLHRARAGEYEAIVIEVGPQSAASDLVQRLRLARVRTPVLLLSSTDRLVEVVRALSAGADDYMTTPVSRDDVVSRLTSLVRETGVRSRQVVRMGKLKIDLERRTLEVQGERVHLTGKEFQMLELLALKRGTTVTKEMFLDHLYGGAFEPVLKIIDVFICKLRKKLLAACGESYIETIWGRGYIMRDPDEDTGAIRAALSA